MLNPTAAAALAAAAMSMAAPAHRAAPPAPPAPPPIVPAAPPAPPAPPAAPPDIHSLRPAFVPLVAAPLDMSQASEPIWVSGDRPAHAVIARMVLKPSDAVVVEQDAGQGAGKKLVLLRAYSGSQTDFRLVRHLVRPVPERIYCADGPLVHDFARILCLEDRDGDGAFDRRAWGLGETGAKAEQLSILGPSEPLPAPLRYRAAAAGEAPEYRIAYVNCGKDHDQPRYRLDVEGNAADATALLQELVDAGRGSSNPAEAQRRMQALEASMRLGSECRQADKVRGGDPLYPAAVADGVAIARLGELVIQVASKEQGAGVRLLGLREPQRLYRLSYGAVVPLSDDATTKQKRLAISQKFDRPVIVTTGQPFVAEGRHGAGDVILTAGFRHGYMGVLTEDTKIKTLLTSRSLPRGTVLYGMPMSSRRVTTWRGIPMGGPAPLVPDPDDVHLTWCVPVQDEGKWTATCLPTNSDGNYTILKGQRPAFAVTSLSYAAGTTTNDGDVPVRLQEGDFGKPLSYRFRIKAVTPAEIVLTQETLFGEEVVDSREEHVHRMAGKASVLLFSGGVISFSEAEGSPDAVIVKREIPFKSDVAPGIESGPVDIALLRAAAARASQ